MSRIRTRDSPKPAPPVSRSQRLRIGVAGCGNVALNIHLQVLARLKNAAIVAVIDPDSSRCEMARRIHPQAKSFASLNEIWNGIDIDALVITAPTSFHAGLAREAIGHGKCVYLEKPIALNISEARELLATWESANVIGMIGFNQRFDPLFEEARVLLSQGVIGRPLAMSTIFTSSAATRDGWRRNLEEGGGVLAELGSHHVDLVHFLLSEDILDAYAQTSSAHSQDATATVQMKTRSGVLVSSLFSFGTADQNRVEIIGETGLLRVDRYLSTECEVVSTRRQNPRIQQLETAFSVFKRPNVIWQKVKAPGHDTSYGYALKRFVNAAGLPATPDVSPDLRDGYRALAVLAAADQSIRQRGWAQVIHS
jgi:1,5-anhydro-D-fructose reductase (1,5-anhydro-D-mannitol-forming)